MQSFSWLLISRAHQYQELYVAFFLWQRLFSSSAGGIGIQSGHICGGRQAGSCCSDKNVNSKLIVSVGRHLRWAEVTLSQGLSRVVLSWTQNNQLTWFNTVPTHRKLSVLLIYTVSTASHAVREPGRWMAVDLGGGNQKIVLYVQLLKGWMEGGSEAALLRASISPLAQKVSLHISQSISTQEEGEYSALSCCGLLLLSSSSLFRLHWTKALCGLTKLTCVRLWYIFADNNQATQQIKGRSWNSIFSSFPNARGCFFFFLSLFVGVPFSLGGKRFCLCAFQWHKQYLVLYSLSSRRSLPPINLNDINIWSQPPSACLPACLSVCPQIGLSDRHAVDFLVADINLCRFAASSARLQVNGTSLPEAAHCFFLLLVTTSFNSALFGWEAHPLL